MHKEAHFENALRSRLHRFSRPLPRNSFSSGADHLLGKDHLGGVSIMFIKARSLRRRRCEMVSGLAENSAQLVSEFRSRPRVWKIIADRPFYLTTYYKWLLISIFVFVTFKNEKYERNKYFDDTLAKKLQHFPDHNLVIKGTLNQPNKFHSYAQF